MKKKLLVWLIEKREKKFGVSRKSIQDKTSKIATTPKIKTIYLTFDNFQVSENWLINFMKKKRFFLKRKIFITKKLPQ